MTGTEPTLQEKLAVAKEEIAKAEIITPEQEDKLDNIILGTELTKDFVYGKYVFTIHVPSFKDRIKINNKSKRIHEEILLDMPDIFESEKKDMESWSFYMAGIFAALDTVVTKILNTDTHKVSDKSFWEIIKVDLSNKILDVIIFPLMDEYIELQKTTMLTEVELKNF